MEAPSVTPASRYNTRATSRACGALAFALSWGCAGATPRPLQPTAAPAPARAAAPASSLGARARLLPQRATFADVVDAARALDTAGHTPSEAGCLISTRGAPQLAADVLVATRPLPEAPEELATSLEKAAGPATVVSAWGIAKGEHLEIALTGFTTTSPASARAPAIALFLTRAGVFVRGAAMPLRARPEALDLQVAMGLLAQVPDPAVVYVTAESAVPLERVVEALRSVPNRFEVALAVALPKGTRLPLPAASSTEQMCPEGLPAPADAEPEGDLDPGALRGVLAPLREKALACALSTGGSALQGGRLELAMRIGIDGRPRSLCMVTDAIGEPVLRRCVIEAARALQFPAPSPAGFVDVQLPLQLAIEGPAPQRGSCE